MAEENEVVFDLKQLLSPDQLAEQYGVDVHIVRRWLRKGKVPGAAKIGAGYVVFAPALEGWEAPETGTGGFTSADGKSWKRIRVSPEEFEALKQAGYTFAERRARKAKAKAAAPEQAAALADDPFATL